MDGISADIERIELEAFASALAAPVQDPKVYSVAIRPGELELPVRVFAQPASVSDKAPLVVTFHGGVDRNRRALPVFQSPVVPLDGRATVLALADPTLSLDPNIAQAWYAGSEHHRVPELVAETLDTVVAHLSPSRIVFASGSAGGHPALYHSYHRPGSVCLVQNALSRISRYESAHIDKYRKTCWPSTAAHHPLSKLMPDDLCRLYRQGHRNSVIWLQNAADPLIARQLGHFLRNVKSLENFLLISERFAAFPGHSYPQRVWATWLQATVDAPTASVDDIAATAATLLPAIDCGRNEVPTPWLGKDGASRRVDVPAPREAESALRLSRPDGRGGPEPDDRLIARRIASWSARNGSGS